MLRNCVSVKATKIDLNNFYHPKSSKFDNDTHCWTEDLFLVCDVTWTRNQRVIWLDWCRVLKLASKWGFLNRILGEWDRDEEFFGWLRVVGALFWVGGRGWDNILGRWEWVGVDGALFSMGEDWWENVIGGWGWMQKYFRWMGVSGAWCTFW